MDALVLTIKCSGCRGSLVMLASAPRPAPLILSVRAQRKPIMLKDREGDSIPEYLVKIILTIPAAAIGYAAGLVWIGIRSGFVLATKP